jgi:sirohydrochlorin ferrochelatase
MRYPSLTLPARPPDPPSPHRLTRRDPGGPAGQQPPLIAVAHGSADPRAAASTQELMGLVRELAGGSRRSAPDIRTAFLGHAPPSVGQVIGALSGAPGRSGCAPASPGTVVVLPLLLTAAYHSEVDLPALLAEASVAWPDLDIRYGDPLGPDPLLLRALDRRMAEAGAAAWPAAETSVVLAAAGSARPESNAVIAALARQWQAARGWRAVVPAYAAAAAPSPADAVATLRRAGARRVVVATYLLAPGFFADRIATSSLAAGAVAVSAALGAAPEVAELVLRRYTVLAARSGPLCATLRELRPAPPAGARA